MSIFSNLIHGRITLDTALTQAEEWGSKLVANDSAFTEATGELVSIAKAGASEALTLADNALGPLIAPAADTLETALEGFLAKATGGVSVVLNPAISGAIDQGASVLHKAIDAWVLEAKAKLAPAAIPPIPQAVGSTLTGDQAH